MKITVLGTGLVGRLLAGKLDSLGHDVAVGTRDPQITLTRTESGKTGDVDTPPYSVCQREHPAGAILDLGGITARAVEMYSRLYFTLVRTLGTFEQNIRIARAGE